MSGILSRLLGSAAAAAITDAYFNLVTLLLNTTSTNGAQNNTFLDTSSIGNTVTRNGTPTQGTFTPFSAEPGKWSGYFDGTQGQSKILRYTGDAVFAFPGTFTIECWYKTTSTASKSFYGTTNESAWTSDGFGFSHNNGTFTMHINQEGAVKTWTASATTYDGNWHHVAFVRDSSNNIRCFYEGTELDTPYNYASQLGNASFKVVIGAGEPGGNGSAFSNFIGYISNFRITKGAALYSTTFTPSTTPLTTSVSGGTVSLLTCQSNRFLDISVNSFTPLAGSPFVYPFSPFLPTAAYDAAVVGGSGLFVRANSDILTLPNNSLLVGSSGFSLETWAYQFDRSGSMNFFGNQTDRATAGGSSWNIAFTNSTGYVESTTWVGGSPYNLTSSIAPPLNAWNHIVWCRTGGTQSIFVNGVRVATRSDMGTLSINNGSTSFPPAIGANGGSAGDILNGYLSGFKIIIGSGGYDATASTITVPTAPPTNTTNTKLLVNFTNAGIYDAAAKNDALTVGNAQVSTAQAKWGTTSMYFDGTGDNLSLPSNNLYNFGSSDFTIEFWFYPPSVSYGAILYSTNNGSKTDTFAIYSYGSGQSPANSIVALVTASGGGAWSLFNNQLIGATTAATWQHVALVRNGSTFKGYMNGVAGFTVTSSSAIASFNGFSIASNGASGDYLTGYIDDLRITRYARYTSNFTPATAAFPLL